jgi:hypothetical protein
MSKNYSGLAWVSLLLAMTAVSGLTQSVGPYQEGHESVREQFVGAWRLAWLEEEGADGKAHKADCSGMLVYTPDGNMSVQVMYRNFQPQAQGGPVQYAQGGYEASFGRYTINERTHTFVYHVEGALVRNLIGKDLTRIYELSGKQLIVKSSNPSEHWRVAWERD